MLIKVGITLLVIGYSLKWLNVVFIHPWDMKEASVRWNYRRSLHWYLTLLGFDLAIGWISTGLGFLVWLWGAL